MTEKQIAVDIPDQDNILDNNPTIAELTYDERVLKAVEAYMASQEACASNPTLGAPDGFRKAADKFGVDFGTVRNRYLGMPSIQEFNRAKSYLTDIESHAIIDFLIVHSRRGFPLGHKMIREKVNYVLRKKFGLEFSGVGENWVDSWVKRWGKHISSHWGVSLDHIRADAVNPENISHWFSLVEETVTKFNITPDRTYAMDETGIMLGVGRRTKVIGEAGIRTQHNQRGGDRELISVLPPICADGTYLRPTVIFPGKNLLKCWGERNPLGCAIAVSEKGYTDGSIGRIWIEMDFDLPTRGKCLAGEFRLLILDGHGSHYTIELLLYAIENNIVILAYPPHTTHVLQGHDVVLFAVLKRHWTTAFEEWERTKGEKVTKSTFLEVLEQPFLKTFTSKNILASFSATGIWPFNPSVVKPSQMQPSAPKGLKATGLPITLASPVRAMVAAFYATPVSSPVHPSTNPAPIIHEATSPTRRSQVARGLLRETSAGFLVDGTSLTSDMSLPPVSYEEPPSPVTLTNQLPKKVAQPSYADLQAENRELRRLLATTNAKLNTAREAIQRCNTQLALSEMHVKELKTTLQAKENKPKTDRVKLFPGGKGRHVTGDEFVQQAQNIIDARKQKEADVIKRRGERADRAEKGQQVADEQQRLKVMKWGYKAAMQVYEKECSELRALGVRKKDLRPKPTYPRKSKAVITGQEDGEIGVEFGEANAEREVRQQASTLEGEDFEEQLGALILDDASNQSDSD